MLSYFRERLNDIIDARIKAHAEAEARRKEIDWWDRLCEKDRRFWVSQRPELIQREEVARWAA